MSESSVLLRLQSLGEEDRDWLLGALTPQECRKVREALQREFETEAMEATGDASEIPSGERSMAVMRLDALSALEIAPALNTLPDWAIALIVSQHPWGWVQTYLAGESPERVRALRSLATELEPVKPAVRQAVLQYLLDKVGSATESPRGTRNFDLVLDKAIDLQGSSAGQRLESRRAVRRSLGS